MGGEHYNHYGSGANYLCLPHNPRYGKYTNGRQSAGYMYGTEYEVSDHNGNPFREIFIIMKQYALSASSSHVARC